ncbi:RNA polymerase sigma factor [Carboxylicivirga sp. N1Y90]|uniref:RNA polymerase sigma factor n=1 Tax=Carboxylicivirga fragile TaxID=3417571 RepID=UPI003D3370A3|nr:RNA polymerase sigma-70 factor [Marinilabiliaceae bacterium N1Y90]
MELKENDQQTLLSLKNGNRDAFDTLFRKYYQSLCRFAFNFLNDESLAEEAVQNTFMYLWEKRKNYQIPKSFKAYIHRSVYNECLRIRKWEKKTSEVESTYALLLPEEWTDNEQEQWNKIKPIINKAINQLPQKCRDIFLMRRQEGLSNQEIANYLNISIKTVENQMSIALKKLRNDLAHVLKQLPILLAFFNL